MFETHLHTAETSACASLSAAEAVRLYAAAGYAGITVTDHYVDTFFTDESISWSQHIERFLTGYTAAKAAAKPLSMTVLLGMELRFQHNVNDYLVYGATPDDLVQYPHLYAMDELSFSRLAHAHGWLMIQAHPFRDQNTPCDPALLDGVEAFNGQPTHHNHNRQAAAFACRHHLPGISGSDCHDERSACTGGIYEVYPIHTERDLIAQLRAGAFKRIIAKNY